MTRMQFRIIVLATMLGGMVQCTWAIIDRQSNTSTVLREVFGFEPLGAWAWYDEWRNEIGDKLE